MGLDLGMTKGRVREGGCFAAWYRRFDLGDVDCDAAWTSAPSTSGSSARRGRTTPDEQERRFLGPLLRTAERCWFVLGWARIVTPEAGIDVRLQPLPEASTLAREMTERVEFEQRLSQMVKLLFPHLFLDNSGWATASGVRGRRAT